MNPLSKFKRPNYAWSQSPHAPRVVDPQTGNYKGETGYSREQASKSRPKRPR